VVVLQCPDRFNFRQTLAVDSILKTRRRTYIDKIRKGGITMAKKILIAFDDSPNAKRAVEFVANHFTADHEITLMSVMQDVATLCEMASPELTAHFLSQRTTFCALEEEKKQLVMAALKMAKKTLEDAGFKNIAVKAEPKKKGVVRDIVSESKAGYDIIIMGRRGLTAVKEFLIGSVSQKVLHMADTTVMIVS
jgi:nucleotide-binding universal stress UspA family protein